MTKLEKKKTSYYEFTVTFEVRSVRIYNNF